MPSAPPPDRTEIVRLLPALGVLVVWTALLPGAGGFNPRDWLPAGIVLIALTAVAMAGNRRLLPPPGPLRVSLLALAAYTVWSFLSMTWSVAPGAGWDAANLLLVTLASGWILALTPWRAATAGAWVVAFSVLVAVVFAIALIGSTGGGALLLRFDSGRYNQPLDYANAFAALAVLAALPGIVVAARPGGAIALKAVGLAAGTFLFAVSLLAQSRGAVLGGGVAVLVLLLAVPFRWRLLGALVVVGVGVGVSAGASLDVYDVATTTGKVTDALGRAGWALFAATLVGGAGGAALAVMERRIRPGDDTRATVRRGGWGLVGVVGLLVVAVLALNAGRIAGGIDDQWQSLRNPGTSFGGKAANPDGEARLTTVDPIQRYDYWRVALQGIRERPLIGDGTGSFQHRYSADRRYVKPAKYPHDLLVRVAGETGVVGLLLWGTWLFAALWGLLRGFRDSGRGERALGATALAAMSYVAIHGSLDWLEAYPTITGPVLGLMVIALAVRAPAGRREAIARAVPGADAERPVRRRAPRLAGGLAAGLVLAGCAISLAMPWIAVRLEERGTAGWRADPDRALADLDRASDWNPLNPEPAQNAGLIALQLGRTDRARAAFQTAIDREETWVPLLELALLDAEAGDRVAARRALDRATALNPREPVLAEAAALLDSERPVDAAAQTRRLFERERAATRQLS